MGPREPCVKEGMGTYGVIIRHAKIARSQYSQPYSLGGGSNVASGFKFILAT